MSAEHTIAFKIYEGGWISAEVTCTGTYPEDTCHWQCAVPGCGECRPEDGHTHKDYGCCINAEWVEESDAIDMYGGPTMPLRDGPIEFDYSGGEPVWRYLGETS